MDRRTFLCGLTLGSLPLKHGLPAIGGAPALTHAGVLVSYGPGLFDMGRRAANHVSQIVKGTKIADLPLEMHTKYELLINRKTAKALGLTLPQSLLLRADHVVE